MTEKANKAVNKISRKAARTGGSKPARKDEQKPYKEAESKIISLITGAERINDFLSKQGKESTKKYRLSGMLFRM